MSKDLPTNPLLTKSTLENELPPFADIRDEHHVDAFETVREHALEVLKEVTGSQHEPTFENTVEPFERIQIELQRALGPFWTLSSSDTTDALQEIEERLAPELAAYSDALEMNGALYERLGKLRGNTGLSPEQAHIIERRYRDMTLAGAGLTGEAAERVKAINKRLASLSSEFDKHLLADTTDLAVHVNDVAELDGLSEAEISSTKDAAAARDLDGYLITLTYPTSHPYLAKLRNRQVRERLMKASLARCSRGNENDNREIVKEITKLRAERATLLGFANHAAWSIAGGTAKTTDAVIDMMAPIAREGGINAKKEQEELAQAAAADGIEQLEAWDWDFYTEKVRKATLDIDVDALKPYFEASNVLTKGIFYAAELLYGITFHERPDLRGWNDDTRVFEVHDADGSRIGLYLLDLYTRDSKRGGAWMHTLADQNRFFGQQPVVCNNLNVPKPGPGEPTLLTLDEVSTFFHEFGHALHGLLSNVAYPSVSGLAVERDFVEFPSQVNEMWTMWPEVVSHYAVHYQTGEVLPQDVRDRLKASETFNQGFLTSEHLSASLLDFEWHLLGPDDEVNDVLAFGEKVRAKYGLDNDAVKGRYYAPYFQHVFSGGYSAGYYGYMWSEVLDADTVEWFKENGGATRENGRRFRERLLSVGGSKDAMEAYEDFRGRPAEVAPLLRRRGLTQS